LTALEIPACELDGQIGVRGGLGLDKDLHVSEVHVTASGRRPPSCGHGDSGIARLNLIGSSPHVKIVGQESSQLGDPHDACGV